MPARFVSGCRRDLSPTPDLGPVWISFCSLEGLDSKKYAPNVPAKAAKTITENTARTTSSNLAKPSGC